MKINKIIASVICISALLTSCSFQTAEENQIKYTHTSRVDGDAFHFFRVVGSALPYESDYAAHIAANSADAKEQAIATEVEKIYSQLFAELDTIGTKYFVEIPVRGAEKFVVASHEDVAHQDTTHVEGHDHAHHASHSDYIHHTQHQQALIIEQFERLSRNTNRELRDFAAQKLVLLEELFAKSGGVKAEGGHH